MEQVLNAATYGQDFQKKQYFRKQCLNNLNSLYGHRLFQTGIDMFIKSE